MTLSGKSDTITAESRDNPVLTTGRPLVTFATCADKVNTGTDLVCGAYGLHNGIAASTFIVPIFIRPAQCAEGAAPVIQSFLKVRRAGHE